MSDFARWTVAVEMLILFCSCVGVVALEPVAARRAPRAWRWAAAGALAAIFGVAVVVVINALLAGEQTPGVKVLSYIAGPAATLALVGVVVAVRRQPRTLAEHREAHVVANAPMIADALSHLPHLEPCHNPDCTVIRVQLSALAGVDEQDPDDPSPPADQSPT